MKFARTALAAAAVGTLVFIGAAPASAAGAEIDPGDSLYALNCDPEAYNDWQLMSVDPSTAVSTKIGDGSGSVSEDFYACAGQGAYNPVTKKSYYIQWEETDGTRSFLASVDVSTGASTRIGEFFEMPGELPEYPLILSMAIGLDGTGYAISDEGDGPGGFWRVNLANAELTFLGFGLCCTWALAVHPVTGELYGIDRWNDLWLVDKSSGAYEGVGTVGVVTQEAPDNILSLQIDEGGRFWVMVETFLNDAPSDARLWSFTLDTLATPVYSGIFDDDPYYTEALLLIPAKTLPVSGAGTGAAPVLAGGLLMLGAALVALTVIRRRAAA